MEEVAQSTEDILSEAKRLLEQGDKPQLIVLLNHLTEEINGLGRHLRRVALKEKRTEPAPPPPSGYASWSSYRHESFVELAFYPGQGPRFLKLVASLVRERDQRRTSVARRVGEAGLQGRPDSEEWLRRLDGEPLPWESGVERKWARELFEEGRPYEEVLWIVAMQHMMFSLPSHQLTRPEADALKKAVDREYRAQRNPHPPKVPRSWWWPEQGLKPTPGGLMPLSIQMTPSGEMMAQYPSP